MKKITIITSCQHLPTEKPENVGLLVECAIDSELKKKFPDAVSVKELIGDIDSMRQSAGKVVNQLLMGEPSARGVPQLGIFKEVVAVELHKAFHVMYLYNYLMEQGFTLCEFTSASSWSQELAKLALMKGATLQIKTPAPFRKNKFKRVIARIRASKFSIKSIIAEFKVALNQLDPFHKRKLWRKRPAKSYEQNKVWFYTTAINYTRIGLGYENYISEPFYYLVENPLTGGMPLKEKARAFVSLYDFASIQHIPRVKEVNAALTAIRQHVERIELNTEEAMARDLFLLSDWFALFAKKLLANGLFMSSVFANWQRQTKPAAVIVGNVVYEGYALYEAKHREVSTVLLQHGVVSDYYEFLDYPVDHYVVRGQYFHDRLSSASRERAICLNPPAQVKDDAEKIERDTIVLMTTPLHLRYLLVDVDHDSILENLLKTLAGSGKKLIVRVHPLERVVDYQNKIGYAGRNLSQPLEIFYDQGGDLDKLLEKTAAVVSFGSTVFLDCINHQVPIIGFDWVYFGLTESLKQHGVLHIARSLVEFRSLLSQAVTDELKIGVTNADMFLVNSPAQEIKTKFQKILKMDLTTEA